MLLSYQNQQTMHRIKSWLNMLSLYVISLTGYGQGLTPWKTDIDLGDHPSMTCADSFCVALDQFFSRGAYEKKFVAEDFSTCSFSFFDGEYDVPYVSADTGHIDLYLLSPADLGITETTDLDLITLENAAFNAGFEYCPTRAAFSLMFNAGIHERRQPSKKFFANKDDDCYVLLPDKDAGRVLHLTKTRVFLENGVYLESSDKTKVWTEQEIDLNERNFLFAKRRAT